MTSFISDVQVAIPNFSWDISRIINDKSCLCYFVQYLEQMSALPLIKFWLDVESYKSAADLQVQNKELESDIITYISDVSLQSEDLTADSIEIVDTRPKVLEFSPGAANDDTTERSEISETINGEDKKNSPADNLNYKKFKQLLIDAKRIFYKYLKDENCISYVNIPNEILDRIAAVLEIKGDDCSTESNECHETTVSILSSIFDSAQYYVFHYLETIYLNSFCESPYYSRYCIDIFTSDNLTIKEILYNEDILFYFMEFLEQVNSRHFSDFWLAAINFKKQLEESTADVYNKDEIQKDALIIYEKYFSLQANNALHVSDQVRYEIEENICSNYDDIKNCFNLPLAMTQRFLEQKYLLSFRKSHLFCKYLSVLFQKIDSHKNDGGGGAHNFNKSESLSMRKNGQLRYKNGLEMESNSQSHSISMPKSGSSDLNIDTSEINDPDLLWRRNAVSGLRFGHIDELGRYRRNYDAIPSDGVDAPSIKQLTTSVKLKNVVRKFINLPEKKIQEEVAWQVAEMIVKDILNVTLN